MRSLDYHWGQVGNSNFYTYLKLKQGTNVEAFEKGLTGYILNYFGPVLKDLNMSSVKELQTGGNSIYFRLTPVTRIHLYSNRQAGEEINPSGSIQYVGIFSAVALLLLLIACINFMNLTTARSAGRAREIGIRKVLGTERKELVMQFLTESTLMVFFSLLIAVGIAFLALPLFNSVASKSMHIESLFSPYILPLLLVLPVAVGLFAGSYPAFFFSAFRPIQVLKGKLNVGTKSGGLRSALVVFQFSASIVLIIGTIVVYRQLHFIQTRDLGFSKDQVLIINGVDALGENAASFKNQVAALTGIKSATLSGYLPVSSSSRNAYNVFKDPVAGSTNSFNAQFWAIDYGYLETMGIKLLKGRNFSPAFGQDSSSSWIINESTASILGYPDHIGKNIYSIDNGKAVAHPIVGVVKNFNYESLHASVGPLIFAIQKSTELASFKVSSTRLTPLVASVRNTWKTMAPGIPFSYRFLDESFNQMCQAEQRVGKIAVIFSILAIIISCLGIFGLATFIAEQRMKEIGIRKVLGASVQGIVRLLSKEFLFLVGIAFLVAAPLAWWFMNQWLQGFVERAALSWWIFATSGLVVTGISLATESFQSIRAAVMNPTKSLKAE